ncbi:MAG: hypothetical protein K1000chlam3_00181 [Chlamydiae bacterium]|nr:hypothetical protein [Chlamydiota bacterium]
MSSILPLTNKSSQEPPKTENSQQASSQTNYFEWIPNEIFLLEIIKYLSLSSFISLSQTCKRFNDFKDDLERDKKIQNLYKIIIDAATKSDTSDQPIKKVDFDTTIPIMFKLYNEQLDRDTLVVANKIANQLHRAEFSSAEEARNWLNDPENKNQLAEINILNLEKNCLYFLPPEIGNLSQLQELYLAYNNLTSIPKELGNLSQLQKLSLYSNQLKSIPKELANLSQLRKIYLGNNRSTEIPIELKNLKPKVLDFYLYGSGR